MIGYDRKLAETLQAAYYRRSWNQGRPRDWDVESWRESILRTGAMMLKSREAEMELKKNPHLCSCADPSDYFCRTTGCIHATVILASEETAFKIITLGLP